LRDLSLAVESGNFTPDHIFR